MSESLPDSARLQGNRLFPVAWESGVSNKRHFVRLISAGIGGILSAGLKRAMPSEARLAFQTALVRIFKS
ncbi:hypothetical protein F8G67_001112 [Neisseria gonorrhoeae]